MLTFKAFFANPEGVAALRGRRDVWARHERELAEGRYADRFAQAASYRRPDAQTRPLLRLRFGKAA